MAPFLTWAAAELGYPCRVGLSAPAFVTSPPSYWPLRRKTASTPGMTLCKAAAAPAAAPVVAADAHPTPSAKPTQGSRLEETLTALDVPPAARLGPWVEHIAVPRDGPASETIAEHLSLPRVRPLESFRCEIDLVLILPHLPRTSVNDSNDSQDFAERLIRFGAVHYCPIHPLPPVNVGREPAGQQQVERAQAARAAGTARHGKDVSIYFLHWARNGRSAIVSLPLLFPYAGAATEYVICCELLRTVA